MTRDPETRRYPEAELFFVKDLVRQLLDPTEMPVHRRAPFRAVTLVAAGSGGYLGLPAEVLWPAASLERRGLPSEVRDLRLAPAAAAVEPEALVHWLGRTHRNLALCPGAAELPVVLGALERLEQARPELAVLVFGPAIRSPERLLRAFSFVGMAAASEGEAAVVALAERQKGMPPRAPGGAWSRLGTEPAPMRGRIVGPLRAERPAYGKLPAADYERELGAVVSLLRGGRPRSGRCLRRELDYLACGGHFKSVVVSAAGASEQVLWRWAQVIARRGRPLGFVLQDLDPAAVSAPLAKRLAQLGLGGVSFPPTGERGVGAPLLRMAQLFTAQEVTVFVPLGWGRPGGGRRAFERLLACRERLVEIGAHPRFELLAPPPQARRLEMLPEALAPASAAVEENRRRVLLAPALFPAHVYEPHPLFGWKAEMVAALDV
jgi:hypothetical protein